MTERRTVTLERLSGSVAFGTDAPSALICGTRQIESRDHALRLAERIAAIARAANMPLDWLEKLLPELAVSHGAAQSSAFRA